MDFSCSLDSLGFGDRSRCRRHRKIVDAGKRSRWLHYHDPARHRWRVRWDLDRSHFRRRKLRRRLDHVSRWRDDPVVAVSIAFQARQLSERLLILAVAQAKRQCPAAFGANDSMPWRTAFAPSRECEIVIAPWLRQQKSEFIVAFAALYLVWGSTYLGIRFAIETIPPFLMAGTRFLLAGLIMLRDRVVARAPTKRAGRTGAYR